MKRAQAALIAIALAVAGPRLAFAASAAPKPEPTPQVNPCTEIIVQLLDNLNTGQVRSGDVFRFQSVDTVITTDNVTIPRNTIGYGVVTQASAAGAHGRPGQLIIEPRYFALPNRGQYPVTIDSNAGSAVQNGSTGNLSSGVGIVPLPFIGTAVGAFNYLHSGKNAVVAAGSRFVVVPLGNLATKSPCSL